MKLVHPVRLSGLWAGFVCALCFIGAAIHAQQTPQQASDPNAESGKTNCIVEPADLGSGPGFPVVVKGKAGTVPTGSHVWVAVHPVASRGYWPQSGEIHPSPRDKSWEVTAYLGEGEKGIGEKFQIIMVLANEEAHKAWVEYLNKGPKDGYPEKPLPSGASIVDQVTYTRTK